VQVDANWNMLHWVDLEGPKSGHARGHGVKSTTTESSYIIVQETPELTASHPRSVMAGERERAREKERVRVREMTFRGNQRLRVIEEAKPLDLWVCACSLRPLRAN
jgi:hypothetical protein